jgi:hypothetical protein
VQRWPRYNLGMAIVRTIEDLRSETEPTDLKALQEFIDKLAAGIPEEEWKKLPPDLSEFHDEYASGLRKYPS